MEKIIESSVSFGESRMDYVCFGRGERDLVILPGLSDGLATVRGTGKALEKRFTAYAKDFRVWIFSRKEPLEQDCSLQDMARDQAEAMKSLGICCADVMGVSQGGMIAQLLAAEHPALVRSLTLVVTAGRINETIRSVVEPWIPQAERGDWRSMLLDATYRSYTDEFLSKQKLALQLLGRVGMPKDPSRFLIQARAILGADADLRAAAQTLARQDFPVLIIGGDADGVVGGMSAEDLAQAIPRSRCYVYHGLRHGLHEEAPDFNDRVLAFLSAVCR